jgi:hypothetical protein
LQKLFQGRQGMDNFEQTGTLNWMRERYLTTNRVHLVRNISESIGPILGKIETDCREDPYKWQPIYQLAWANWKARPSLSYCFALLKPKLVCTGDLQGATCWLGATRFFFMMSSVAPLEIQTCLDFMAIG